MKKILSFKHWQLFLLIVICGAWTSPSPLKEVIHTVSIVTFTIWIYAIGTYGQDRIGRLGLKPMNVKLFKANVIIVGALFLILLFNSAMQEKGSESIDATNNFDLKDIIFILLGIYVLFAFFHPILFVCKTIAKIELQREVSVGDYFTNLILMFFFFIGVWILQPRITRLIITNDHGIA